MPQDTLPLSAVQIRDAFPQEVSEAIRLAIPKLGIPSADRAAQSDHFLAYLGGQGLEVTWNLVITQDEHLIGSCLGIVSPGRTGLVMCSPCDAESDLCVHISHALQQLESRARKRKLCLLQTLIPDSTCGEVRALKLAGYKHLADLRYLASSVLQSEQNQAGASDLTLEYYHVGNEKLFRETLAKTYIDSLDCPGLKDIRTVDDILQGHRASGIHDPQFWSLARKRHQPVGVLLLTHVPLRSAMEIIYVGVVPEARGRGYGTLLVEYALEQTRLAGRDQLVLAVDHQNTYAMKIYKSRGFIETDRRHAWILSLI